ncbi:MAG: GNAT family N-acetyltransferase [Nanoarchaeota archaeon]|jgi:RimJ/RimL family protein N-acetyltransferase|nr:GNAT family N-acetyltransferase [Nanoarchaeota archaeon]
MKNVLLETERLILRKPQKKDYSDLQEGINNINIAKEITSMPHPYTLDMVQDYFGKQINKWEDQDPKDLLFVIELKSEEKVIGAMGLYGIDRKKGIAETGSWINEDYWRHGYITEAKIAANTFAFNSLGLEKLISPVFADNIASNATQRKMGYEFIGKEEEKCSCLATGEEHEVNIYELAKAKWRLVLSMIKEI